MESAALLAHIVRIWPFTSKEYPALAGLTLDEADAFMLTHVMKHQAKGIAWVNAVRVGTHIPELTEVKVRLINLMTNCLRFHELLKGREEIVESTLSWWGTAEPRPCDTVTLNRIKHSDQNFRSAVHDFAEGTLFTLGLLEKVDHGEMLPKERLEEMSGRLMTACVGMLVTFGISQKAYARHLLEPELERVEAR